MAAQKRKLPEDASNERQALTRPKIGAREADVIAQNQTKVEDDSLKEHCWKLKLEWAKLTREIEVLSLKIGELRSKADKMAAAWEMSPEESAYVAQLHAKKLTDHQKKSMIAILRDVTAHRNAYPFKTPVDTNLYKDYLLRVSTPMDLSTVKSRLDGGLYTNNLEGYLSDVRQIFRNAYIYNAEGTDVYAMAKQLEDKFEERIKKMVKAREALDAEQSPEESKIVNGAKQRYQDKALTWLNGERLKFEPQMHQLDLRLKNLKSEAASKCQYVPLAEKHQLVGMFNRFTEVESQRACQMVVWRHPASLPNFSSSESFDLDLGQLDALTLRQLLAFGKLTEQANAENVEPKWPGLLITAGTTSSFKGGSEPNSVQHPIKKAEGLRATSSGMGQAHAVASAPVPAFKPQSAAGWGHPQPARLQPQEAIQPATAEQGNIQVAVTVTPEPSTVPSSAAQSVPLVPNEQLLSAEQTAAHPAEPNQAAAQVTGQSVQVTIPLEGGQQSVSVAVSRGLPDGGKILGQQD